MIIVNEKPLPWSEGMTIASLLTTLDNTEFCSVVRLNNRLVSSPNFETTPVPDQSRIDLLPLVGGG